MRLQIVVSFIDDDSKLGPSRGINVPIEYDNETYNRMGLRQAFREIEYDLKGLLKISHGGFKSL